MAADLEGLRAGRDAPLVLPGIHRLAPRRSGPASPQMALEKAWDRPKRAKA